MEKSCLTCANEVAGGSNIRQYVSDAEFQRAMDANARHGANTRYCKAMRTLVPDTYGDGGQCGRWTPDR